MTYAVGDIVCTEPSAHEYEHAYEVVAACDLAGTAMLWIRGVGHACIDTIAADSVHCLLMLATEHWAAVTLGIERELLVQRHKERVRL